MDIDGNKEITELTLKEFAGDLKQRVIDLIGPYSVGLLGVFEGKTEDEVAFVASGTLAEIDGNKGILTAQHVSDMIRPRTCKYLGLMLSAREPRVVIDTTYFQKPIAMTRTVNRGKGPDLSFVVLPDTPELSWLKAKKSFYMLSREREDMLNEVDTLVSCCWALFGCPFERTEVEYKCATRIKELQVQGMIALSNVENEWSEGGYDYVDVAVRYGPDDTGPVDFGGVSGGGLWLLPLRKNLNTGLVECERAHLCGVAFFQTDRERVPKSIRCHGSQSIYKHLVPKVIASCSTA